MCLTYKCTSIKLLWKSYRSGEIMKSVKIKNVREYCLSCVYYEAMPSQYRTSTEETLLPSLKERKLCIISLNDLISGLSEKTLIIHDLTERFDLKGSQKQLCMV